MSTDVVPPQPGPGSRVQFFDLRMRAEPDDSVVVGRADTGDFVALPEVGARIIERLQEGRSLQEVDDSLVSEGAEIDVEGFVDQLGQLGFVRSIDGIPHPDAPTARKPSLPWLQQQHVAWLFTLPAYALYAMLAVTAGVALVLEPEVRPRYSDLLFTDVTSVILAVSTLMFLTIVALHETAHLAAARASGVPARISLGTRLYSLVAQTDVSGVWAAPRRERLRTYLAGMGFDLVLASVLVLLRLVTPPGTRTDSLLGAAVVLVIVGLAGQFQLFMRTDVYFVVADLLRARNLFEDATVLVIHLARRAVGKGRDLPDPLRQLPAAERRVVRGYAAVMVLGTVAALTVFAVFLLPAIVLLLVQAVGRLTSGIADENGLMALDGAVTLLVEGGTQVLILYLILRSRVPWLRSIRGRLGAHEDSHDVGGP